MASISGGGRGDQRTAVVALASMQFTSKLVDWAKGDEWTHLTG